MLALNIMGIGALKSHIVGYYDNAVRIKSCFDVFLGEISYSRSQDFFKIKNLLDVVYLFFPRLSSAGVSVLPSHGAPLPAQVRASAGDVRRKDAGR